MTDRIGTYVIRSPMWGGRAVGIADFRLQECDIMKVRIAYRKLNKSFEENNILCIESKKALMCPTMEVKSKKGETITLHIIPIADMEFVGRWNFR